MLVFLLILLTSAVCYSSPSPMHSINCNNDCNYSNLRKLTLNLKKISSTDNYEYINEYNEDISDSKIKINIYLNNELCDFYCVNSDSVGFLTNNNKHFRIDKMTLKSKTYTIVNFDQCINYNFNNAQINNNYCYLLNENVSINPTITNSSLPITVTTTTITTTTTKTTPTTTTYTTTTIITTTTITTSTLPITTTTTTTTTTISNTLPTTTTTNITTTTSKTTTTTPLKSNKSSSKLINDDYIYIIVCGAIVITVLILFIVYRNKNTVINTEELYITPTPLNEMRLNHNTSYNNLPELNQPESNDATNKESLYLEPIPYKELMKRNSTFNNTREYDVLAEDNTNSSEYMDFCEEPSEPVYEFREDLQNENQLYEVKF